MSPLVRTFVFFLATVTSATSFADELLRDLEELYDLTSHCEEKSEVALRWGMVLRQSPMQSPERRSLLEAIYSKALEPCAPKAIRAQATFELGIVAFGDGDFPRAKLYFTQLLNTYRDDLLVVDSLYWLGETYSELGDMKRARRAYLGVAERSVGEMRGWGLFKSSRLTKSKSISVRDLVRLLDLLSISSEVSQKFKRSVADAFVADWSKATNQIRGGVRKHRRWRSLTGPDASLLMRSMGRYYIGTSDKYATRSLLASLQRLKVPGWEFEERLWRGLLEEGTPWYAWFNKNPDILTLSLSDSGGVGRLEHVVDVLEIAVGRSSQDGITLRPEQLSAIGAWVKTGSDITNSQLTALLKLHQLGAAALESEKSPLPSYVETLVTRCLEDDGRKLQCSAASLSSVLQLWSSRRSALEREMEGSQSFNEGKRLWELLKKSIESRRVVFSRAEELARLLEFAVVFKEPEGFSAYASLIPDDLPDSNCEITKALSSTDREDVKDIFWEETRSQLERLLKRGLGACQKGAQRLADRIEARLDLVTEVGRGKPESFISKHEGKAGLSLVLIADWRRVFEAGNLEAAQERMSRLLKEHGAEREVRSIATEWGDWLERNNDWLRAAEHYQRVAESGGKAIGFYALSKSGRAYRLAGEPQLSTQMMRQAQQRAMVEMNGTGLEKICDYWWRQWSQGDKTTADDVRACEQALLRDRLGDRCESLVRVWSLPRSSGEHQALAKETNRVEQVREQDCEAAQWESFLGHVRRAIEQLGESTLEGGIDERQLASYLGGLESTRKAFAEQFDPYLRARRPVLDALALAYYYGRLHEALYEGLMRLEDPSLGAAQGALWRRKLTRRGEPLRSIALSAYQKALSLRSPERIHPLESSLQEALLRLEALSTQPALDYLPLPGEQ